MKIYEFVVRSSKDRFADIVEVAYSNDIDELLDFASGFLSIHDGDGYRYIWTIYQEERD